ncbi:MAG: hypothetical protein EOS09_19995 [Mesorhizobium sp.]|nr:MAG: hypothetical protein EOS09_19995 [Mesorhizobium sp.]
MLQVCGAPHCPAGHFSPYSDGEKDAVIADFANLQRCRKGAEVAASPFSPFTGRRCRQTDEGRRRRRELVIPT